MRKLGSSWIGTVALFWLLPALAFAEPPQKQPNTDQQVDWLRGTGDQLEMRIRGRVLSADGSPSLESSVTLETNFGDPRDWSVTQRGSEFECWLPVNDGSWYSLNLLARSQHGLANQMLTHHQLRRFAEQGMQLQLQPLTKTLTVLVHQSGRPVSDATIELATDRHAKLRGISDAAGLHQFLLRDNEQPARFTAWTDDFRFGGYQFNRTPVREPESHSHAVELYDCRDLPIRVVDQQGAGIAGVDLTVQVATPPPHFNFLGVMPHTHLRTDANGGAVLRYYPDREDMHRYADLHSDQWVQVGDVQSADDGMVITVQPKTQRRRVSGRLTSDLRSPAGFLVQLRSFQGERERKSDHLDVHTDADGYFSADVLPGATYAYFVTDPDYTTGMHDGILAADDASVQPLALELQRGTPVEIQFTEGPEHTPVVGESILTRSSHSYSWEIDGRKQNGLSSRDMRVETNPEGVARVRVPAEEFRATVYQPDWRGSETIQITEDEPAKIHLHRPNTQPVTYRGQLVAPHDTTVDWTSVQLQSAAIDGETRGEVQAAVTQSGAFTLRSKATKLALFVATADQTLSGTAVIKDPKQPATVTLQPTLRYRGRLLDSQGQPLAQRHVRATVSVEERKTGKRSFAATGAPTRFRAHTFEAASDDNGDYEFPHLPPEALITISMLGDDDRSSDHRLAEIMLEPGEERPVNVSTIDGNGSEKPESRSLAARFAEGQRDCQLNDFRLLVVAHDQDSDSFVNRMLRYDPDHRSIADFLSLRINLDQEPAPDQQAFLKDANVSDDATLTLCAYDDQGKQIGRLEFAAVDSLDEDRFREFIQQHAIPDADARKKWEQAFEEARRTDRRVWARISQRYCGPCFTFARWLDDRRELIEKDYVLLKIDDVRDKHGKEVADRLTQSRWHGVPFHAIFDTDESSLIDSVGPLGNIGSVSSYEGLKHARKMLSKTSQRLSDAEIEAIVSP